MELNKEELIKQAVKQKIICLQESDKIINQLFPNANIYLAARQEYLMTLEKIIHECNMNAIDVGEAIRWGCSN